jgi:hypothetical protein
MIKSRNKTMNNVIIKTFFSKEIQQYLLLYFYNFQALIYNQYFIQSSKKLNYFLLPSM